MMKGVAGLQQVNLLLGAVNLCATYAGFAIMYAKLDKMSVQISQVEETVKKEHDVDVNYEFHKVLSEHSDMLDCRKTGNFYKQKEMRQLVDSEYNVLKMLIECFMKDLTSDKESIIFSIYSMASMFTVSLRYFDELYYISNSDREGDDVWHTSHDNWMAIFDVLLSKEFIEKIQDHGIFDLKLTTYGTDMYYINLCDQIKDMKETILDNQKLVVELGNEELMTAFETYVNHDVAESIQEALSQTEGILEDSNVLEAYKLAMKQMGLAV